MPRNAVSTVYWNTLATRFQALLFASLALPLFALAQPIVKSGPCPAFTRSPMKMPFGFQNNTMQDPLSPEQSVNCIETAPGFQAQLWASEQDAGNITALLAFTFDERGRMWAVESKDYPNTLTTPYAGHDRILILEDADHDGRVDKAAVFAEGFNLAQALEWTPAGLVVAMPPYLLLLEDKNGDDKADDPKGKILYNGFKRNDTHMTISNLHMGIDNWIYGMSGSQTGTIGTVKYGAGFWRARLDGSQFEFLSTTTNNSWGFGFMEDGQIFGSTANGNESVHHVLKGKEAQQLLANGKVHPITKDWMQHAPVGTYSAASGHDMYTARLFPKEYWNKVGFVCEPTVHLIAQFSFQPKGSTWKGSADPARYNFFASTDAWTGPIMAKVGPDGALWIIDWYSYIIQHNGDPTGPGSAFLTDLRDKKYCRIYRIVPVGKPLDPILDLRNAGPAGLAATLSHANMLWRLQAQRLLLAKAAAEPSDVPAIVSALKPLLAGRRQDEADNDPAVVHALWTLAELGVFKTDPTAWDPILESLLLHPAGGVRRNVLMAMPRSIQTSQSIKDQGRVNDPNPHVRLQALITLSEIPGKVAGISLYTPYKDIDKANVNLIRDNVDGVPAPWAALAAAAAGIPETATLPDIPGTDPTSLGKPGPAGPGAGRIDLRFRTVGPGSFTLAPDARLPAGRVSLFDAAGSLLAEAGYDGREWTWLKLDKMRLEEPGVRIYRFSGAGMRFTGKVAWERGMP